ncbi:hypothetical protein [Amycolatopsis sp. NPDC051372]|uniref:hypothetical protein n=1 Tax=unclassified Amycolatopsis TaxID=2618356 RepID=UPI003422BEED
MFASIGASLLLLGIGLAVVNLMREESQEDRRLNAARELADAISDEALRNQVRAMLSRTLLTGSAEQAADAFKNAFDQRPAPPEAG